MSSDAGLACPLYFVHRFSFLPVVLLLPGCFSRQKNVSCSLVRDERRKSYETLAFGLAIVFVSRWDSFG